MGIRLILFFTLLGCTQKYSSFPLIKKVDFDRETYTAPVMMKPIALSSKVDELSLCFSQWLFNSNAEKEKNDYLSSAIRNLCPGSDYLIDTDLKETWWTTILYTQACLSLNSRCPQKTN